MSPAVSRMCSVLLVMSTLMLIFTLVGASVLAFFTMASGLPDFLSAWIGRDPTMVMPVLQRLAVALLIVIAVAPGCAMLWFLRRLMVEYTAGRVFTDTAAKLVLRIGQFLILGVFVSIIVGALRSVVASYDAATGDGSLAVEVSSGDLLVALIGGLLIIIGAVMGDAARLRAENESFI